MARIRTIKPEFWGDEKLAPMSPVDRLVFLGLISMADDAGRLVDNVKTIDGFIFPDTEDSSRDSLDNLARTGRILRYQSASGQRLIQVANWLRHQKVDKPAKYVLPSADESSRESRDNLATSSRSDLLPTTPDLLPPTSEQRAQHRPLDVLGVEGERLEDAKADLVKRLGGSETAQHTTDDFLNASPAANRYAWARGLVAMLEPLGGKRVEPGTLLLAMQDFLVADRAAYPFVGRVFRAFVDGIRPPRSEQSGVRYNGKPNSGGDAALVLGKIKSLIRINQQPGQAANRFIPRKEIVEMGADVVQAYDAIGGAERILTATGEQMGFVIRDFTAALEAAHHD